MYKKQDYTYILPPNLIAETPIHPHHDAKVMVIDREKGCLVGESTFWNLDHIIPNNRIIYFNNSKVLRARIPLNWVAYQDLLWKRYTLKEWEIFYLKTIWTWIFEALVRPGKKFKKGSIIHIGIFDIEVIDITAHGRILRINNPRLSIDDLLSQHGNIPLPPYIEYSREKEKDYQTVFAEKEGSVAAPTASLHFTKELLSKIKNEKRYITLHVWLGTFRGLDTDDIRQYQIHTESVEIAVDTLRDIALSKISGKKIVAVGTTACRTLESLPSLWHRLWTKEQNLFDANIRDYWNWLVQYTWIDHDWIHSIRYDPTESIFQFETSIYIVPWHTFQIVDDLITNFHLPESSLLVLVSAFIGHNNTLDLYRQAIEKNYRFYSFWDGMYIQWKG